MIDRKKLEELRNHLVEADDRGQSEHAHWTKDHAKECLDTIDALLKVKEKAQLLLDRVDWDSGFPGEIDSLKEALTAFSQSEGKTE